MSSSQENQAKLNNAQWLSNYRQKISQVDPQISPVDMSQNISVALRDPVYGQATATGLATGQSLLNSWIAGANARARKQSEELANERWIKQQQDLADERKHRLDREALADKRYDEQLQEYVPDVEAPAVSPFMSPRDRAFANVVVKTNAKDLKGGVARNPIEAQQMRERQQQAKRRTEEYLAGRHAQIGLSPEETKKVQPGILDFKSPSVGSVTRTDFLHNLIPWRSDAEVAIGRQTGSRENTVYKNFAQLKNAYASRNNPEAVQWINRVEREILRKGDRVLQIVRPGNENAPTHIITNNGDYELDPATFELRSVQAEIK